MKRFIIITAILISNSLFSMEERKNNTHKYYVIFKNSLPAQSRHTLNTRIDFSHAILRKQSTFSLNPNEETIVLLRRVNASKLFLMNINGQEIKLKFNYNYGPLQLGDSIDIRLIDYTTIGLFCNDQYISCYPLRG